MKQLALPFWLAGGYDSPQKLRAALDAGASGIQVGTAFALCVESGLDETLKSRLIEKVLARQSTVHTDPLISPTGFSFKVAQLEGTMLEPEIYQNRIPLCNLGMLRQLYQQEDGQVGFRCPAEPAVQYLAKGGKAEGMIGRNCLCNNLLASAGYPQHPKDGYIEPPVVTAGDRLVAIGQHLKPASTAINHTAGQVTGVFTALVSPALRLRCCLAGRHPVVHLPPAELVDRPCPTPKALI